MSRDTASQTSIWVALGTFLVVLATLFLSHPGDGRRHQSTMQTVSILLFALMILSLRRAPSEKAEANHPVSAWWLLPSLVLGTLAYAPMVPLGFVSDDFTHVLWARRPMPQILLAQFAHGQYGTFFRPLGFASIALDYRLWHGWAPGWHIASLAIHLAAAASFFYLCKELGCDGETSGTASLLFAVLPINIEAVAWMAARFDLVSTLLMLWTLIFYLRARNRDSAPDYWIALGFFASALLAKESAYIIPLVLLAIELLLLPRTRWEGIVPFFLCALVAAACRVRVLGSLGGYRPAGGAPGSLTLSMNSLAGVLVRAPSELLFGVNWQQPRVVLGYLLTAALAGLLLPPAILRRRSPDRNLLAFALLWCFLAALPAQSMLMIPPTLTNSRVLYFSSAGAALLLALLLARIPSAGLRRGWILALALCCVAATWHNIAAWAHASKVTQDFLSEVQREVPNPAAGTEFVVHDMPTFTEGGVYLLLHRGLGDGIRYAYGRDDLFARRSDELPEQGVQASLDLFWRGDWRGKSRPLVTKTSPESR